MQLIGDMYFPDIERHFQRFADAIGDYQRPQREKAFEYVTDWSLCIDLGANVGIFSRHFATRFDEVWAIEPLSDNIECLQLNVPKNVRIMQVAVGQECRNTTIYKTPKSLGGAFVCDDSEVDVPVIAQDPSLREDVPMITLDSLEIPRLGLLKLDIQGSEVIALRGGVATLKRCRPVVLIEEKPLGGPGGSTVHIDKATELLTEIGMVPRERVGADRVYTF